MRTTWKRLHSLAAVGLYLSIALTFATLSTNSIAAQARSVSLNHPQHSHVANVKRASSGHAARSLLLKLINKGRAKHNVKPLKLSLKQSACALRHSKAMKAAHKIFHSGTNVCIAHKISAENVGLATGATRSAGVQAVNKAMFGEGPCPTTCAKGSLEWAQHGHYYNLINPKFNKVGLGIAAQGRVVYVTEDFVG